MRSSFVASILAFAATQVSAQYNISSDPFNLVIYSTTNATINGIALGACHTGAAIESLCAFEGFTSSYIYNTSSEAIADPTIGETGVLAFNLPLGGDSYESTPLSLYYSPTSNVALGLFQPGYPVNYFTFTDDVLGIPGYLDDTVSPPTYVTANYYRWYLCQSNFEGYTYVTLNWALGVDAPENPSCQAINVPEHAHRANNEALHPWTSHIITYPAGDIVLKMEERKCRLGLMHTFYLLSSVEGWRSHEDNELARAEASMPLGKFEVSDASVL
ncbi:hypothetical protein B7494_g561 [Chlorociboria aeruginascens]|nr:hypothetical protein B7494_g561 [Chlorociboria aeruginascens]